MRIKLTKSKLVDTRKLGYNEEEEEIQDALVSTIPVSDVDYEKPKTVDFTEYKPSYLVQKQAFESEGFNLAGYEEDILGGNGKRLDVGPSIRSFFKKVDITKKPITETIHHMQRSRQIEYLKNGKTKVTEYLTYGKHLEGIDILGNRIFCSISEGEYFHPIKAVRVTQDDEGNKKAEYILQKLDRRFYIPFSKSTVDKLLQQTGTDKDRVIWYYRPSKDESLNQYKFRTGMDYKGFTELSYEAMVHRIDRVGGYFEREEYKKNEANRGFIA